MYDNRRDTALVACPVCGASRSNTATLKTVNVADKLAELLTCDDVRERLAYRHNNYPKEKVLSQRCEKDKVFTDVFDGELYKNFVEKNLFDNKYDIALKIDIDGFKSKFSSTKLVMVHCVVLNYDISEVRMLFCCHSYKMILTFF